MSFLAGCNTPTIFPNSDPNLRKTSTQFAAEAAKHHPYKADAPRAGEAAGRAEVDYNLGQVRLVNLSDTDWHDMELWVNQKYEVTVPYVAKTNPGKPTFELLVFRLLFDDKGNHFPTYGAHVDKVEIYRDGKMYDVPLRLAD